MSNHSTPCEHSEYPICEVAEGLVRSAPHCAVREYSEYPHVRTQSTPACVRISSLVCFHARTDAHTRVRARTPRRATAHASCETRGVTRASVYYHHQTAMTLSMVQHAIPLALAWPRRDGRPRRLGGAQIRRVRGAVRRRGRLGASEVPACTHHSIPAAHCRSSWR